MYQSGSTLFSILTSHRATKQHRLFLIDKNSPLDGLRRFGPELGTWQVHLVAVTRQRQLRPTSAKATKHKRVADNHEKLIVYEDCEDSEPDVYDGDHDTFETDVPLTGGRDYVHRHPLLGDNQLYHKLAIARARAIVNAGPSRDRASTIPPLQYLL
jgi:hypothetical protein